MASLILLFISLLPVWSIRSYGGLTAQVETDSQTNQRLVGSRYRLIERIKQPSYSDYSNLKYVSSGAFGLVYRAIDTSTGSEVALKLLQKSEHMQEVMEDERAGCGAQKKSRDMAEKLGYPKERILDCITHNMNGTLKPGEEAFLVYEWAAGEDLDKLTPDLISKHKDTIFRQLLEAVHIMSAAGISHKDLKPANIKVAVSGNTIAVKVLDFGLAEAPEDSRFDLFRYAWSPPEAMLEYDHKRDLEICPEFPSWDLWSIAVIYYGLDTLAPPSVADITRFKCKKYGTELAKVLEANHHLTELTSQLNHACAGYQHSHHSAIKLPTEFWIEQCFLDAWEARGHSAIQQHRKMIAEILLLPPCARPSVEEFVAKFKSADEGEPSEVRKGNEAGQPGSATAAVIKKAAAVIKKKANPVTMAICKNGCGATSVETSVEHGKLTSSEVFPIGQGKRVSYKPSPLDCMGQCYSAAEGKPCAKDYVKVSKIRRADPPHKIVKLCCQVWQNYGGCIYK